MFKLCRFAVLKTTQHNTRESTLIRSGQAAPHPSDYSHRFQDGDLIQSESRDAMNLLLGLLGRKHVPLVHWHCEPEAAKTYHIESDTEDIAGESFTESLGGTELLDQAMHEKNPTSRLAI